MTDGEALLAAIVAQPAEDTPRLVYADWLDERGAEGDAARAEFIRVQIEIARFPAAEAHLDRGFCPGCYARRESLYNARNWHWTGCRWAELRRRERELWDMHVAAAVLFEAAPSGAAGVHLDPVDVSLIRNPVGKPRRGFIEAVTCPSAAWLERGDLIRARQPVRRVVLTTLPRTDPEYQFADTPDDSPLVLRGDPSATVITPEAVRAAPGDTFEQKLLAARYPDIEFELPPAGVAVNPGDLEYLGHGDPFSSVPSGGNV